jgi:hypothetical protein
MSFDSASQMLPKEVERGFDDKTNRPCFPLFGLLNMCLLSCHCLADNRSQDGTSFNPFLVSSMERLASIISGKVDHPATILPQIGHP